MALLRIVRDSGYADRIRTYKILIDGATVGKISNGETKEFPIAPGHHEISLKIDWCGSNTVQFTATEGDVLTFDAKSNLRGLKLAASLWHVLFAWSSWIILTERH